MAKSAWTPDVALDEMRRWCAADEKSHVHVRTKLLEHKVYGEDLENIISTLISENYLNEARFASAYVSGKFKINGWGRVKIKNGLSLHQVSSYNCNKALQEIDEDQYQLLLEKLFVQKLKDANLKTNQGKQKMMNFLAQRGFESHLIFDIINNYNP